jgi:hypothetical protein
LFDWAEITGGLIFRPGSIIHRARAGPGALCKERPVRALFVSGYLGQAQQDPLLARVPFLFKPFAYTELREKIQVALSAPPLDM